MKFGAQKQIPVKRTIISWKFNVFQIQDGGRVAIFKIVWWPYLSTKLSYFGQILCKDEKSHTNYGYVTKIATSN